MLPFSVIFFPLGKYILHKNMLVYDCYFKWNNTEICLELFDRDTPREQKIFVVINI